MRVWRWRWESAAGIRRHRLGHLPAALHALHPIRPGGARSPGHAIPFLSGRSGHIMISVQFAFTAGMPLLADGPPRRLPGPVRRSRRTRTTSPMTLAYAAYARPGSPTAGASASAVMLLAQFAIFAAIEGTIRCAFCRQRRSGNRSVVEVPAQLAHGLVFQPMCACAPLSSFFCSPTASTRSQRVLDAPVCCWFHSSSCSLWPRGAVTSATSTKVCTTPRTFGRQPRRHRREPSATAPPAGG